jgi:sodium pump decarboxylase gamma subunit
MSQLLQAGLNLTVIGMGVVFALLTLLVFIIRFMSDLSRKFEGAAPNMPQAATAQVSAPSLTNQTLVGVISAAIAAHRRRR